MKKVINVILVAMVVVSASYVMVHYERPNCKVVEISDGVVTVADKSGNVWEFYGENFRVGERVTLKMHTNYSADFTDDVILDVEKN